MATKLSKSQISALKGVGITETTEEAARKKLLTQLKSKGITEVDDDSLEDLIEMLAAFTDGDEEEAEEEEEDEDEADADDEDEDDEDAEEEEEEEKPAPAKKGKAPVAKGKKPVAEEEDDDDMDTLAEEVKKTPKASDKKAEEKAKAATKKVAAASPGVRGVKFDKENEEHVAMLDSLKKVFPEKKYEHKLGSDGVSIRLKTVDSTNRALFVFNGLKIKENVLRGVLALNALRMVEGEKIVKDNLPEEFEDKFVMEGKNLPLVKDVSVKDVAKILAIINPLMEEKLTKLNSKLNTNRENLAASVNAEKGGKGKKVEAAEEEDEDEVEAPAPAKKKKK